MKTRALVGLGLVVLLADDARAGPSAYGVPVSPDPLVLRERAAPASVVNQCIVYDDVTTGTVWECCDGNPCSEIMTAAMIGNYVVGITEGYAIDVSGVPAPGWSPTVALAPEEVLNPTWGAGAASYAWTWDTAGTDPVMTVSDSLLAFTGGASVSGSLACNGAAITTDDATFALLNATATTVNAFGAATAINIGATTGTTTFNHNLVIGDGSEATQSISSILSGATDPALTFQNETILSSADYTATDDFLAATDANYVYALTEVHPTTPSTFVALSARVVSPPDNMPVWVWSNGTNAYIGKCSSLTCANMSETLVGVAGNGNTDKVDIYLPADNLPVVVFTDGIGTGAHIYTRKCATSACTSFTGAATDLGVLNANTLKVSLDSTKTLLGIGYSAFPAATEYSYYVLCDNADHATTPCTSIGTPVCVSVDTGVGGTCRDNGNSFKAPLPIWTAANAMVLISGHGNGINDTYSVLCATPYCLAAALTATSINAQIPTYITPALLNADGTPSFGFMNASGTSGLAKCGDANCSSISITAQVLNGVWGANNPASGFPVLGLTQAGSNARIKVCAEVACSTAGTVYTDTNWTGTPNPITMTSSGRAFFAYANTGGDPLISYLDLLSPLVSGTDVCANAAQCANGYFKGDLTSRAFTAAGEVTAALNITTQAQGDLRLGDADSSNYTGLQAPAIMTTNVVYTMPTADGAAGTTLSTNGTKTLSWATVASGLTAGNLIDISAGGQVDVDTSEAHDVTWGDGTQADQQWTFNGSGTDFTMTAGSNLMTFSGALTSARILNAPVDLNALFKLQSGNDGASSWGVFSSYSNTATDEATLYFLKGRGTHAAPSALQSGDTIGSVRYVGQYAAGSYTTVAKVEAKTTEAFSGTNLGTKLVFHTTPTAAITPLDVMELSATSATQAVVTLPVDVNYNFVGGAGGVAFVDTPATGAANCFSVDGTTFSVDCSGKVGIGTAAPLYLTDFLGASGLFGADLASPTTRTASTTKAYLMLLPHYSSPTPSAMFRAVSASTYTEIDFGGGSSSFNAATDVIFWTGATTTTTIGTERFTIPLSGAAGLLAYFSPIHTDSGDTGGVCFRELAAGGTDAVCHRAADALAGPLTFTDPAAYPTVAGSALVSTTTGGQSWRPPGRSQVTVCGDQTTVNNNTVYYGPNRTLAANATGLTCDITAAGNTTEATVDDLAFDALAFQALSMVCRNATAVAVAVSYTLRTAAGATTPSVTCTIPINGRVGTTSVGTTTAIASGATMDVAVASTGDLAANGFVCTVEASF